MHFTPQDIINENRERRKALATRATAYNPINGEGCTGERIRISYAAPPTMSQRKCPSPPNTP